jgi:GH43 family beta-xylosidase
VTETGTPIRLDTFRNPVLFGEANEDHGDPFVIKYLDRFYLYHTGETYGRRGVSVHSSPDLVNWEFHGFALEPAETGWAYSDLWAPEVVYERGLFYMYISATRERTAAGGRWDEGPGDDGSRRIGLARATDPLGPFVLDEEPITSEWSIDAHPFRDDDGSMWLFYNIRSEATRAPNGALGTGTVSDRLLAIDRVEGAPTPVTFPTEDWEGPYRDWYWNEGPYVLKRRGVYYQMYSGGFHADASYGIGFAEARSPRGPWAKYPGNPIVRSAEGILGPGHHSFVYGPDAATVYAVYHGRVPGDEGRKVHLDRLFWVGDRPAIAGPTSEDQPLPPRARFVPGVPHWRGEVWARGGAVDVRGVRFELPPEDAWHQVEAVEAGGRVAVRVGGVLQASFPSPELGRGGPFFDSDGELAAETVTSCLRDDELHELPARSSFAWEWGGEGALELSLALRGSVELTLGDAVHRLDGDADAFRLVRLAHASGAGTISVHAREAAAVVADLAVYAR